MPVQIIIRENGKQCMIMLRWQLHCFQMYAKTSMYCNTIALSLSIVHKNAIVKLHEICRETEVPLPQQRFCYVYICERRSPEANSGLSTSNLILSSSILSSLKHIETLQQHILYWKTMVISMPCILPIVLLNRYCYRHQDISDTFWK